MKIAMGSDHMGLDMKLQLADVLRAWGHEVVDFGTYSHDRCHYPVYAARVAEAVRKGEADRGVLACATGVGMSISAAKVPGIRPVLGMDVYPVTMSRRHNDTNVLCVGGRVIGIDAAVAMLEAWLNTPYDGGRHDTRLAMIAKIEAGEIAEVTT